MGGEADAVGQTCPSCRGPMPQKGRRLGWCNDCERAVDEQFPLGARGDENV